MNIEITENPNSSNEKYLVEQLNNYNDQFREKDGKKISIYVKDESEEIIAGLSGVTYLNWLHVEVLWVSEKFRGNKLGTKLISIAEGEALLRGCHSSNIETFSYQSLKFYIKNGYVEFGRLSGYGEHEKYYLQKKLKN